MKLSMKEKKILYAYGCPSHHNTVTRLKWLTALTVDPEAKRRGAGAAAHCWGQGATPIGGLRAAAPSGQG